MKAHSVKTYLLGLAALFCMGCASKHPQPLAAMTYRTVIPQKRPLPPVRPQLSDSARVAHHALVVKLLASKPLRLVPRDTVRDTVYLPAKITVRKRPARHCKVWE